MVSPGHSKIYLDQLLPEKKLSRCLEKRRSYPAAFAKYRFYLDIRSARAKAALIEDILALGGVSSTGTFINFTETYCGISIIFYCLTQGFGAVMF